MKRLPIAILSILLAVVSCGKKNDTRTLTLVSYNVGAFSKFEENSMEDVAALLEGLEADFVALNELDSCNLRHPSYQLQDLSELLGGRPFHFASAFPYAEGAYGNGVLSKEDIIACHTIPLSKGSGSEPRSVAVVETRDCVFASVHLDHRSEEARLSQMEAINFWFDRNYGYSRKPIFLAGDFNSLPDSPVIKLAETRWERISETTFSYSTDSPHECIDYIFAFRNGAAVTVLSSDVITEGTESLSDHFPVVVKVQFTPAAEGSVSRPWEYWRHPDKYLHNEADVLFGLIDETLQRYPASPDASPERQLALASLDALVHETRNDDSPQLHAFLDRRMARVVEQLNAPSKKKGIEIFKLYNDGFIVRSGGVTVGFDLCATRGRVKFIQDAVMRTIIGRCDALFISHRDPDHADGGVVSMASEMGIPVYAPEDYRNGMATKVRMKDFSSHQLPLRDGRSLEVQALPGHQDSLQNNIYVVAFPGGYTAAHCGDQYNRDDLTWLKEVSSRLSGPLDVLIIDCWALEMKETITGFSPRLVVSGHENEMGHTIDHREAFWLTQYKFDSMQIPFPSVVLCWGEGYSFKR